MGEARHVRVMGRVQGVFFRQWTVERARALKIAGWVRNNADGSLEAWLEGEPSALDAMITEMRRGPSGARVEQLHSMAAVPIGATGFVVQR